MLNIKFPMNYEGNIVEKMSYRYMTSIGWAYKVKVLKPNKNLDYPINHELEVLAADMRPINSLEFLD